MIKIIKIKVRGTYADERLRAGSLGIINRTNKFAYLNCV